MAGVFVIVVNFRTAPLTVQCLASLAADVSPPGSGRHVIVVDNCSGDDSATQIESAIRQHGWQGWVELLAMPRNGGFAYGNNAAIARARQLDPELSAVVLLNPDAVVRAGVLGRLIDELRSRRGAGIAGAAIEGPDGELVVSAHVMPSPLGELEASAGLAPLTRLLSRYVVSPPPSGVSRECDWVSGACMAIRREVLDAVGPFDEGFFLYYEEVDFCRRARRAGWSSWYVADARVVHREGSSTGIGELQRRRPAYWFASRRRYFAKAHGALGLVAADVLWAIGRASFVVRRAVGLGGANKIEQVPERFAVDLLVGDAKAIARGDLQRQAGARKDNA